MLTIALTRLFRALPPGLLRFIGRSQWAGALRQRLVVAGSSWIRRRDVTIAHGAGAGLRFNAGGANPGYALGTSEPLVQDALVRLVQPGDVVFDIGANVGFYTLLSARLAGPLGHVYAFEPLAENRAALEHNVVLNACTNITVFEEATWNHAGHADLVLKEEPTWARLAALRAPEPAERVVQVTLVAVDDLVEAGTVRPPSIVKIDVEGAEIEALQGMARTLAAWRPIIICEMHGRNAEFGAMMRGNGYALAVLEEPGPVENARWDVHVVAIHPVGPVARQHPRT